MSKAHSVPIIGAGLPNRAKMTANPNCWVQGTAMEVNNKMGKYLYGTCPICGKRLCRAIKGSQVEVFCVTCKKNILVEVASGGRVISTVEEDNPDQEKVAQ